MKAGTLKKVDLHSFWKHEALDFTTWLVQKENFRLLSDEIGIDIELEAKCGTLQCGHLGCLPTCVKLP